MKKLLLGATALAAVGVAPALAADLPARYTKAPPMAVAPIYSWTGCYVGIEGGGARGRSRQTSLVGGVAADITNTFDLSGGLVGGTVGCNYQVSKFVFGVEGDGSWTNKRGSSVDIAPFNPAFTSSTYERSLYTVRGRAGVAFDRILLYVTGGAAAADVGISAVGPVFFASENQTVWGWTVGGGVELAFAQNWSAKVEYLHIDFGNPGFFNPAPAGFANRLGGIHLTDDIGRVGVNYKFNWAPRVVAKY